MKHKIIYITIAIITISFSACKKYFEVEDSTRDTIPKTFATIDGFRKSIIGTYGTMQNYYANEFYIYPEVTGNMVDITNTASLEVMQQQQDFSSTPEEEIGAVGYIWRHILTTIANANNIIENAPIFLTTNTDSKNEIDQIVAQALFVRALAHFDLCRVYAQPYNYTSDASHPGIPIVLKNPAPEDAIGRSTVKQVYTQIITDLETAEKLFGNTTPQNAYYASKKTVQALLARVHLYAAHWDDAIKYATAAINATPLAYGNQYAEMFNALAPGVEAIFRLNGTQRSKNLGIVYSLNDPKYVPADTLMSLFDNPSDIRLSLFKANPENPSKYLTKKWTITGSYSPALEKYDAIVLRASEMYLIRSEAYLAKEQFDLSAKDLKTIIGRALEIDPNDVTLNETATALKQTIIRERAKEFCFEGHNFFDINRMKQTLVRGYTTSSIIKKIDYPSDLFILPIPQSEIDANPAMKGNPTINK